MRKRKTNKNKEITEFFSRVKRGDSCWLWEGGRNSAGYGIFSFNGLIRYAHRWMWEYKNGDIPQGLSICHKCDQPRCVNPDHLFPGSQAENMQDCVQKDRHGNKFKKNKVEHTLCPTV
jgi:hypothetical protein